MTVEVAKKTHVICHTAKVKLATAAHSMADVKPFFSVFNIPFESKALKTTLLKINSILANQQLSYSKVMVKINFFVLWVKD